MKINLSELREIVQDVVLQEAKAKGKKKSKKDAKESDVQPRGFTKADAHDFSKPIENSIYKRQGEANFGPYTLGPETMDSIPESSSWRKFVSDSPSDLSKMTIWESANHWYDHQGFGLGGQTPEGIAEKKIGFAKLKNKLAHKKGITNPAGLAASIGRKKYGAKKFAQMSKAGRK